MCGICGVVNFDRQPVDKVVLEAMTRTLSHRGPDVLRLAKPDAYAGLGHTRLKVIDLSESGNQPMSSIDGKTWIVFNGEIYNYRELRAELQSFGRVFVGQSDTEVILQAYAQWQDEAIVRLDGMFALGIWDQYNERLLLARDRMGKKPLFYWKHRQRCFFASEIKALLRHPEVICEVNTDVLPSFFLFGYAPSPETFYKGVQKLPPGHLLVAERGVVKEPVPYWSLTGHDLSLPAPSLSEARSKVRDLLKEAVRKRLIADVPLGAFLSGGLDSTVVVGLMSELLDERVCTFSIGFSGDERFDERSFARLAAERYKTKHTEFVVEPSAVDLVEKLVWHHDGPFADSSAVPTYILSGLTREHVTVALNGDGGDEIFAGYLRFYAALLSERVPLWVRRWAKNSLEHLPEWGNHRSPWRRLQKFSGSAALPLPERLTRWVSVFYDDLPDLLPQLNGATPSDLALNRINPYLREAEHASALGRLLNVNIKTYLLDDLLVKMDRCSMAHGLETRSPLLDTDLVEYVSQLPDSMKLRWGKTKWILRQATQDFVPKPILNRDKMGFGVPLRAWFSGELRSYLGDHLLNRQARLRNYVQASTVERIFKEHQSGRSDHSHRLWTLLTFEVWLRGLQASLINSTEPVY